MSPGPWGHTLPHPDDRDTCLECGGLDSEKLPVLSDHLHEVCFKLREARCEYVLAIGALAEAKDVLLRAIREQERATGCRGEVAA